MMDEVINSTQQKKGISSQEITVLVVEDNVSNFVLIARMLGYMGIHCEWKTSGYEVVEYADTLPSLDLILMDIRLPYEDGYGALTENPGFIRFERNLGGCSNCRSQPGAD